MNIYRIVWPPAYGERGWTWQVFVGNRSVILGYSRFEAVARFRAWIALRRAQAIYYQSHVS